MESAANRKTSTQKYIILILLYSKAVPLHAMEALGGEEI
jgi:hypothetical protein